MPETTLSLDQALRQAVDHHRAGRLHDAEKLYRAILQAQPRHPDANHNLGVLAVGVGQTAAALPFFKTALEANPRQAQYWLSLIDGLIRSGQTDAARQLIGTARQHGVEEENLCAIEKQLQPAPDRAEQERLVELYQQKRFPEMEACARDMIRRFTAHPFGWELLAPALKNQRKYLEANDTYREALRLAPESAMSLSNFAACLNEQGSYEEAARHAMRAIELDAGNAGAWVNRGNALMGMEESDEAAQCFREALQRDPDLPEAHNGLGAALKEQGEIDEAKKWLHQSVRQGCTSAYVALAGLDIDEGNFTAAKGFIDKALQVDPDSAGAWALIPSLRKMTSTDTDWLERAERMLAAEKYATTRVSLLFAMGKFCDDTRDHAAAFAYYRQANELKKQINRAYDRQNQTRRVDFLIDSHTSKVISQIRPGASDSQRPLFIVGMPRSGTSLLEQILASHPQTFGAGELHFWTDMMKRYKKESHTAQYDEAMLRETAAACLANLDRHSQAARRVVDKMPGNFHSIGFIHACFPNARILHAIRNPVDTCLSIYFQNFKQAHDYANDLDDLVHYYGEYRRLMAHWQAMLPAGVLLEVPYEAVVEDQEGWSRRVIDFIGLEWDERCLDFHQTQRRVGTSSNWQVRQPIYKTSRERWRNYAEWIGPLLAFQDAQ